MILNKAQIYILFLFRINKNNYFCSNKKFVLIMKKVLILGVLLISIAATAPSKRNDDAYAIKQMCGCFEVTFNFAETFNYSQDSLYKPSKTKVDKGLEWAQLVTDEKDKIQIQHLLQVGDPSNPYIVKHWRQDWLYENTDLYEYNADNKWDFIQLDKKDVKSMDSKGISG
ncbi:hypothetical protein JCM19294_2113 [Nonlabens tegetincola]|uniref:Uncharacterized protein n=1 Tax=Nonlabens tegetincola TaxID=323273 RepID=A0A090Q0R0_9FLAO|nr:hypothetical protein JCM19294_2113 [Nonlabens tegetincola]